MDSGYFSAYSTSYEFLNDLGLIPLKMWDCFLGSMVKLILGIKDLFLSAISLLMLSFRNSLQYFGAGLFNLANSFYLVICSIVDPLLKALSLCTRSIATAFSACFSYHDYLMEGSENSDYYALAEYTL